MSQPALGQPETIADPYGYYRALREKLTLTHDPTLDAWLVARHGDVVTALRNPALSVRQNAGFLSVLPADEFAPLREFFGTWLSFSDPPDHTRRRAPWTRALAPRTVAKLRPDIERIADHLIDKAAMMGGCEMLSDFRSLPALAFARFLGLDYKKLLAFRPWIEDVGRFMTMPNVSTARQAQQSIARWRAWLDEHLEREEGGLLGMLAAEDNGLSHAELFALVGSLVTGPASKERGANEPTVQFLAKSVHLLLENPELLASLRAEPDLIPAAVDELLRIEPPFHFVTRYAVEPVELGGVLIEPGQRILLLLASANRDPACFHDPDRIVLDRRDNRHVAFGFSTHFCLGAPLARVEIEVTLAALLRRLPGIKRTGDIRWRMEGGFRALEGLSLEFDDGEASLRVLLDQVEALPSKSVSLALNNGSEDHE